MTTAEPSNCAPARVAQTCSRESVWSRIIPRPTPWIASSTPSQSHKATPLDVSGRSEEGSVAQLFADGGRQGRGRYQEGERGKGNRGESNSHIGTGDTRPRQVQSHSRSSPPDLAPSWCTETDSEDWQKPRVHFRVFDEDTHEKTPDADEEDGNEDDDCPLGDCGGLPQELPVPTAEGLARMLRAKCLNSATGWYGGVKASRLGDLLWTRKPVITQDFRDEEPDNQFSPEQRLEEVGHIRRDLVIEFWQTPEHKTGKG